MTLMYMARRQLRPFVRTVANRIVRQSDVMARLTAVQHQMLEHRIDFSRPDQTPADAALREVVGLLVPCAEPSSGLIRVGAEHDGGYVMADDFRDAVLLSMGVGWDDSWEDHALRLGGKKCLQFDHTIRRPPRRLPRSRHVPLAIAAGKSSGTTDLATILASDHIGPGDSLVVKMDIEGSEWPVLADAPDDFLIRCRQLVVEFHEFRRLADPDWAASAIRALHGVRRHMLPIHLHANNAVDLVRLGNLAVPDAMEVSFVNRASKSHSRTPRAIRSELDRPSDPRIPEVDLEGMLKGASGAR